MRFAGFSDGLLVNGNSTISGWLLMGLFLGLWTADALEPHQSVFVCCSLSPSLQHSWHLHSELVSRSKIDELFKLKNYASLTDGTVALRHLVTSTHVFLQTGVQNSVSLVAAREAVVSPTPTK